MRSIGIDFGTSNSSIAVFDGARARLLPIDPLSRDPRVMRSLLYIRRGGDVLAGQQALDVYRQENTGREVKLERVWIGEVELTYAEIGTFIRDVYALVDTNAPGRLFQSLKRFLAHTSFHATDVFGTKYTLEELLAELARQMLGAAETALGEPVRRATVGRPVRFADEPDRDRAARIRLAEAWELAGLDRVDFVEEPVGAIHHHALASSMPAGTVALVFDFGGGTLDISVARVSGRGVDVLTTAGVPVGGDLLDGRISEVRLAETFGSRARYRRTGLPLPSYLFAGLRSWQSLVELNRGEALKVLRQAVRDADQPGRLSAFEALITRNYGFELFQAIESAKVRVSDQTEAVITLNRDGLRLEERLTRGDFEDAIRPQIADAKGCVLTALAKARLEPGAVGRVITTGGSSLIPAFRGMLLDLLPRAELQQSGHVHERRRWAGRCRPWQAGVTRAGGTDPGRSLC